MGYIHTKFEKAADEIKGMNSVQDKINSKTIPVETNPLLPFAYAPFYISWETNKVILVIHELSILLSSASRLFTSTVLIRGA